MTKFSAQKKISIAWFLAAGIILVLFLIEAYARSNNGDNLHFDWLVGYVSPGLSLVTGTLIYSATNQQTAGKIDIEPFFYKVALGCSLFYFLSILAILLSAPMADKNNIPFPDHLKTFNTPLSFVQSVALAMMGIFFVKPK